MVVLHQEDHRQPVDRRPVHRLVPVAARGGAVAEEAQRAACFAAQAKAERASAGDHHHVGQHRDHPDDPEAAIAEVDVALAPMAERVFAPHVVGEDLGQVGATDQMGAEVADQRRADGVCGVEGPGGADADRLLSPAVVEGPGDLSLLVEGEAFFLDLAHQQHVLEEPEAVLARQLRLEPDSVGSRSVAVAIKALASALYSR